MPRPGWVFSFRGRLFCILLDTSFEKGTSFMKRGGKTMRYGIMRKRCLTCGNLLPIGRKNPRCTDCLRAAGTPGHGGNSTRWRGRR